MTEALRSATKVDRSALEERVYTELRNRIMARDFPPGTALPLRQVADALDVSPTPVRDALRRLQNDGLVEDGGKQGCRVSGLTAKDIADLFGARLAIEGYTANVAITTGAAAGVVDAMREIVGQFPDTFDGNHYVDYERFQRLDTEFHTLLVRAAGNDRLVTMYRALNVHLHLARIYQREIEQRALPNHQEHLEILMAVERGDAAATLGAVEAHIVNVRDHILGRLQPGSLI